MRKEMFAVLLSACLATVPVLGFAKEQAAAAAKPVASAQVVAAPVAKVNINTAGADELSDVLVGVGPAKAQAIVAYRKEKGGFKSAEELAEVKGIGASTLEKNRDRILLK
ncbi:MAG: helix-hairpin-helix domain-containing protein [Gammaproteobacteria bacterium]|nr:helix-hairpin-helix domain-containing protein [Gammaproteobacteria bacterium]